MPTNNPPQLQRETAGRTGFPLNSTVVQNLSAQIVRPLNHYTTPAIAASVTITIEATRGLQLGQIISFTNPTATVPTYGLVTGMTPTTLTLTRLA
jgi:hypothetical protein